MTYQEIHRRLLAIAFIVAAPVLLLSALIWAFGIDVNPGLTAWGSGVEGLVGYVGYIALIPVWLELAARVGVYRPVLGAVATVTALIGVGGAIANMTSRVEIAALTDIGIPEETWDAYMEGFLAGEPVMLLLVLMSGTFGPLTSILVGIGLLRSDRMPGVLLIVGGGMFFVGQALTVGTQVAYPLALALWCVAMVPIGIRLWNDETAPARVAPVASA